MSEELIQVQIPEVKTNYLTSSNVLIKINNETAGLIQEFIITETRGEEKVELEISRLATESGSIDFMKNFSLELIENRETAVVTFRFNDCSVQKFSKKINAENYFIVEKFLITSSSYDRRVETKRK